MIKGFDRSPGFTVSLIPRLTLRAYAFALASLTYYSPSLVRWARVNRTGDRREPRGSGTAREWRGPRGREPRVNHERRFLSPEWVTSGPFPTSLSPPPPGPSLDSGPASGGDGRGEEEGSPRPMTSPFPTVPVSHLSHGTVCVSEGASHIPYPWRAERHQTVALENW